MFKWKKLGKVFDPTIIKNRGWLSEFAQGPSVIEFDDFIRVYFSCRPKSDKNGQYVSYSAYVDLDKNELFTIKSIAKEPILGLGQLGCFDEFGIYPVSVLKEGNNYLAYYGGWTRCESVPFNVAIGHAISRDNGKTFKRLGNGPVLSYTPEEPFILSGPKIRKFNNIYYLFYIAGRKWEMVNGKPEPVYKIRVANSNNGVNWKKNNTDLIENKLGENEAQASPDVIFSNGKYHMFFCYRQASDYRRNKKRTYRIGYASSEDLINWKRDDLKAGIDVSVSGWDAEMVAYPHVFILSGKTYMFYLGNQVGKYGFGLAELEGELV